MANRIRRPDRICQQCFNPFWPKRCDRLTFCSRSCSFAHKADTARRRTEIAQAKAEFAAWAAGKPPMGKRCRGCGRRALKHKQYCPPCRVAWHEAKAAARKQSEAYREAQRRSPSRRADKARRKALQRGKIDGAERFDPLEVLARDGWRCHICGVSTPKRLRGSYDDRAPELDHIVPLAAGGKHTRQNTACACRRCNREKGQRPLGQLRLVA